MLHFEKNDVRPTVAELMAMDRAEGLKKELLKKERTSLLL